MTKVTTLGGSAAGVGTGQGCAGYLIEHDGTRIVLDLGPDTLLELRKHADMRALDAIVVSHLHMDHILDLFALRFALAYAPVKQPRRVPLWLPPGGLAFFAKAADVFAWEGNADDFFSSIFDLAEYDPDATLRIGNLEVRFLLSDHPVPCWSMRIHIPEGNGRSDLVYTADTADIVRLTPFAAGAHVLVSEATMPETPLPGTNRPHISAGEAATLANDIGAGTLVLTHIWEENNAAISAAQAAEIFAGNIVIARPGVNVLW